MRWILLLVVSVLLHIFILKWTTSRILFPQWPKQAETIMIMELKAAPVVIATPVMQQPTVPKPKLRGKRSSSPKSLALPPATVTEAALPIPAPPEATVTEPDAASTDVNVMTVAPDPTPDTATGVTVADIAITDAKDATPPALTSTADTVKPPESVVSYKVDPPPSAELKYAVQAIKSGQSTYGSGKITWQSTGHHAYTISGEASVLLFTVLNFRSEGELDQFGVAPVIYSEKRFRRSETNTHFNRERNMISFSASTVSYPRKGGEQDRASIIWQLVGIGRGDGDKFMPDAELDIFVAGTRDGDIWRIRVIGEEDIQVDAGKLRAWHVVRVPRPGSYELLVDIWLAPQQEWYPVKIRFTETNGDYLDMSLSKLNLLKAQ